MNEPIYIGDFTRCYDGEEEIYKRFPDKKRGVLTQMAYSKTLKGATQKALDTALDRTFVIHILDTGKYLIYV